MSPVVFLLWLLGLLNITIWLINLTIYTSNDKSGAGLVMMFTVPFGVFVGLVSLIIVGFLI